jgi:hypothetical protein
MPTAEKRVKLDPTKCMVCQGSLGLHPMKVKVDGRIGRLCNRVNRQHAEWLLDRKMDAAYLRITYRRRGGILGIIVLMLAFISLLWVFSYTTDFKGPIVAAATFVSIIIGAFLVVEFRTITVGDRMRRMLTDVERERPIRSAAPTATLESMVEIARSAEEEPPMADPFATDLAPAPTQASPQRTIMMAEDGIPGIPQPVVAAKEWEVMAEDIEATPAPAGTPVPAAHPPPGTQAPPTPPMPLIEDLPDDTASSQAPPPMAPAAQVAPPFTSAAPAAPVTPPAPPTPPPAPPQMVQAPPPPPPVAAPPALVEELPTQVDQRPPPSTTLAPPTPTRAPPPPPPATPAPPAAPAPPVPQQYQPPPAQQVQPQQQPVYQQPPVQQPPVQQPPVQQPPVQQPPVQQPPVQQPPAPAPPLPPTQQVATAPQQQPQAQQYAPAQQQPQKPKKTPQEEADEWEVDWE